jgi:uncharacterized protein YndB with AHSA1/START domain
MDYNNNRTITLERTFNAPIDLVWEAWTQPEHIAQWWGPKGMETEVVHHDFRVGGTWEFHMKMKDGNAFISNGSYIEIDAPHRMITTANFIPMTEGVELHIILKEKGDQTHFAFHVVHETEAYCIQQEKMGLMNGWGSVFDRLDQHLSQ